MKVMVIVKATRASEAGEMPSTELLTAMGAYNQELVDAGIMLDGAGLKPSSQGARVRFSGTNRTVVRGPFAEISELIAGFWVWNVKSLEEAIDWVKKCPNPMLEDSDIEIRTYFEAADFDEAFTPELREQEASILAQELGLGRPRFEDGTSMRLVGLNQRYTMESRTGIPNQWEAFIPRIQGQSAFHQENVYGVSWNTSSQGDFDYLTGVEPKSPGHVPDGMCEIDLEACRYVIFEHAGHVSTMPSTFETIWKRWVPDCGLKVSGKACFEKYTPSFDPSTGMGGMEIWIPLSDN